VVCENREEGRERRAKIKALMYRIVVRDGVPTNAVVRDGVPTNAMVRDGVPASGCAFL
jgi:hypothetical protein